MKVLCIILLFANVVLFVLGNWFATNSSEPPREEINADKIQLLDASNLPATPQTQPNN